MAFMAKNGEPPTALKRDMVDPFAASPFLLRRYNAPAQHETLIKHDSARPKTSDVSLQCETWPHDAAASHRLRDFLETRPHDEMRKRKLSRAEPAHARTDRGGGEILGAKAPRDREGSLAPRPVEGK